MTTTTDDASPAETTTLPARQPGTHCTTAPSPGEPPADPLGQAWDVLAQNCDLPATERGLLKVLTEYRKALHALATHVQAERATASQDDRH
jgi:hypothetical protein